MRWLALTLFLTTLISCSLYESDARKFLREQGIEYRQNSLLSINEQREKHCRSLHIGQTSYDMNYQITTNEQGLHLDFKHSLAPSETLAHCRFSKSNGQEFSESEALEIERITELHVELLSSHSTKAESPIN